MTYRIRKKDRSLKGKLFLSGSKSLSNRVLIIEALSGSSFEKKNMADAKDTKLLQQLLSSSQHSFDAQDAGTTFRFLTAYLAFKKGDWILTGNERMQLRPIGDLVNALRSMGAEISFLREENFPPLKITGGKITGNHVRVNVNISSQFVSALLMIAPCLPTGLSIEMIGDLVSEPYIEMTLSLMKYFGVHHSRIGNSIHVSSQDYRPKDIFIESDWSAASYFYELAAFAGEADLELNGLLENSFQGDSAIAGFMKSFEVETQFGTEKVFLSKARTAGLSEKKKNGEYSSPLHFHLNQFPDLAPAMFTMAAGLSQPVSFSGLEHLAYKESNREEALRTELAKCGTRISNSRGIITVEGNFSGVQPHFSTYKDHRMAMAFAPLAMVCKEVFIEDPMVVNKSYPAYWDDLRMIGFEVDEI